MKKYLKYPAIFVFVAGILFMLLVLTAMIPQKKIKNNLEKSIPYYMTNYGVKLDKFKKINPERGQYLHYYADTILLNIMYNIDTKHPIKSVMWDKYYETEKVDTNFDFINTVKKDKEANTQYIRYWHGSMVILRPLLVFFNMEQLYFINMIIMYLLAFTLFVLLMRKDIKLSIIFLLSLISVYFYVVPYCFEFTWTFYIMFLSSIISIHIKDDKKLLLLLFINGITTCFFDFLTTEILTLLMPLLLYIIVNKKDFKSGFKLLIKAYLLWFIGYSCMFVTKWILSGIILHINPIPYVKDNLMLRINGVESIKNIHQLRLFALARNFYALLPLSKFRVTKKLNIMLILIFVVISLFMNKKFKKESFVYLTIGITPYIRYLFLANHSFRHSFFTFRDQLVTVFSIIIIIIINFDLKNSIIGGIGNGINNINAMFKRRKNNKEMH